MSDYDQRPNYTDPENLLQRAKAIRSKCVDCCGGNQAEVRACESHHCALWPWRMGKHPRVSRVFENPTPRYRAPAHLPVMADDGTIVQPEDRPHSDLNQVEEQ